MRVNCAALLGKQGLKNGLSNPSVSSSLTLFWATSDPTYFGQGRKVLSPWGPKIILPQSYDVYDPNKKIRSIAQKLGLWAQFKIAT